MRRDLADELVAPVGPRLAPRMHRAGYCRSSPGSAGIDSRAAADASVACAFVIERCFDRKPSEARPKPIDYGRSMLMRTLTCDRRATAWAAFERRDRSWDGRVIGAVTTTGIYCKPSCPARRPEARACRSSSRPARRRARRAIAPACAAGPTRSGATAQAVAQAARLIERGRGAAARWPSSPPRSAMRRTISSACSPAHSACRPRLMPARSAPSAPSDHLRRTRRVTDAIYDSGYGEPERLLQRRKERLGMTPSAWRDGGRGETIRWTTLRQPARADADRRDRQGHLPADLRRR